MATYVLSASTLISTLMVTWANASDTSPTIALNGYDLIVDADAVSYNVTITNTGGTCHLELRNGGRIKLAATLPTSVCPWVDPGNPLPESNFAAGLTANASAEIQLGSFGLGGGPAKLPTATRSGRFWGVQSSISGKNISFVEPLPLHAGDKLISFPNSRNLQLRSVVATGANYVELDSAPGTGNGTVWGLAAGGICITRLASTTGNLISEDMDVGTLCLFASGSVSSAITSKSFRADRVFLHSTNDVGANDYDNSLFLGNQAGYIRQCAAARLFAGQSNNNSGTTGLFIGEFAGWRLHNVGSSNRIAALAGIIQIGGGRITGSPLGRISGGAILELKKVILAGLPTLEMRKTAVRIIDGTVNGVNVSDTQYETSGTVSRVARSDFPTDTDLPDAFYFAPATASDVPWRYEDYWVRKGETLRLSCRAMRGGDNGAARVAIGEMAVWVPAEGMPTLAEWILDCGEPLVWRGGQIAWTNDTGEDCQVRVWSMASGIHGAYLRVWRATGGAM